MHRRNIGALALLGVGLACCGGAVALGQDKEPTRRYVPPTTHTRPAWLHPSNYPASVAPLPTETYSASAEPEPVRGTVHAGSFCDNRGDAGLSERGTTLMCLEASDGRLRWKRP